MVPRMSSIVLDNIPDAQGHFGVYGGRYVPETLMHPLQELENEYLRAREDPEFQRELGYYLKEFCGRPTPLYFAERLTRELGGAKLYLKKPRALEEYNDVAKLCATGAEAIRELPAVQSRWVPWT